jgi:hypothetical protein
MDLIFSSKGSVGTASINQKKFWWYSFYAWTSPLLMSLGVFLNQIFYWRNDSFKADVGETICFLNTQNEEKCKWQNCSNEK